MTTADTTAAVKPSSPIATANTAAITSSTPAPPTSAVRRWPDVVGRGTAFPVSLSRPRPMA